MGGPSTRWKVGLCCCWRKGWDVKQKMWTAINKKQLWVVFRPFLQVEICFTKFLCQSCLVNTKNLDDSTFVSKPWLPGRSWNMNHNLNHQQIAAQSVLGTGICTCCIDPQVHGEFTWFDAKFHAMTKIQSQHVFKGKLGFPFGKEFSNTK